MSSTSSSTSSVMSTIEDEFKGPATKRIAFLTRFIQELDEWMRVDEHTGRHIELEHRLATIIPMRPYFESSVARLDEQLKDDARYLDITTAFDTLYDTVVARAKMMLKGKPLETPDEQVEGCSSSQASTSSEARVHLDDDARTLATSTPASASSLLLLLSGPTSLDEATLDPRVMEEFNRYSQTMQDFNNNVSRGADYVWRRDVLVKKLDDIKMTTYAEYVDLLLEQEHLGYFDATRDFRNAYFDIIARAETVLRP